MPLAQVRGQLFDARVDHANGLSGVPVTNVEKEGFFKKLWGR